MADSTDALQVLAEGAVGTELDVNNQIVQQEQDKKDDVNNVMEEIEREETKMDVGDGHEDFLELNDDVGLDDVTLDESRSEEVEQSKDNHEDADIAPEVLEEDEEEEPEETEDTASHEDNINKDPNVMPQVNVSVLAQRKWQVKVYPLKPGDFVSGEISRVFKHARESLLYLLSPGINARGKGEMYVQSVNQTIRCVLSLMKMEFIYPEINVEIIKKDDDGAIEEKGLIRFDSKLTRILAMPPGAKPQMAARKRDRLIGSVFVKNLPPGTSKDTLRVMFPFAQEINYNPEKFKEGTARLVLHYRSHVIPCLKAFARIELGGNVLELHPLSKRKRADSGSDSEEATEIKQRRKSGDKEESKTDGAAREKSVKTSTASRPSEGNKPKPFQNKTPAQRGRFKLPYRPNQTGFKEGTGPKPNTYGPSGRGRANAQGQKQERVRNFKVYRDPVTGAVQFRKNKQLRGVQRGPNGGFRAGRGRASGSSSGGNQSSNYSRSPSYNRGMGSRSTSASDSNLAVNAEATKEMVLLQNQLSMAIKSQLAMLNQTQMAVEQAKRGASSIAMGSDVGSSYSSRPSSRGRGSSASSRGGRSLDQYRPARSLAGSSVGDYGDTPSAKKPPTKQQQRTYTHNRPNRNRGGSSNRGGGSQQGSSFNQGSGGNSRGRGGNQYRSARGNRGGQSEYSRGRGGERRYSSSRDYTNDQDWDRESRTSSYMDPYGDQGYSYERSSSEANLTTSSYGGFGLSGGYKYGSGSRNTDYDYY